MKAYNFTPVKSTSIRRKPVSKPSVRRKPVSKSPSSPQRKPVSPQNADVVINPLSTPSLRNSLTTIPKAQQVKSTSTTPEDRTLGRTSESIVEVSGAVPNCDLPKYPYHPYFSPYPDESSAPKASSPWITDADSNILGRAQTAPVELAPAQFFAPENIDDKKRRRRKFIRNGVVLYITFIS
jgi:hypothetical protein